MIVRSSTAFEHRFYYYMNSETTIICTTVYQILRIIPLLDLCRIKSFETKSTLFNIYLLSTFFSYNLTTYVLIPDGIETVGNWLPPVAKQARKNTNRLKLCHRIVIIKQYIHLYSQTYLNSQATATGHCYKNSYALYLTLTESLPW